MLPLERVLISNLWARRGVGLCVVQPLQNCCFLLFCEKCRRRRLIPDKKIGSERHSNGQEALQYKASTVLVYAILSLEVMSEGRTSTASLLNFLLHPSC